MNARRFGIVAAGALVAAIATPATAQIYSIGTGKQGFFTYSAGAAIAKVAADRRHEPARASRLAAPAPMCPASMPANIEFGLANELETHYAVTGQVIYKDKPQPDLRVVAVLTPLLFAISSCARIRRSRPSPTSRASACRAITPASA